MQVNPLTSLFACGIFLLAPKLRTTPLNSSTGSQLREVVLYNVFGILADTSYFHQSYLSPHMIQAGGF